MKKILLFAALCTAIFRLNAQETYPVNGVHHDINNFYVFKNCTVHKDYQTVIDSATLLVHQGKVVAVGQAIEIPKGAVIYDLNGDHIYPSVIDPYSDYGMPDIKKEKHNPEPQFQSKKKGPFSWNEAIHPEIKGRELYNQDSKKAEALRKIGVGAVLTHQKDGIARGTSVFTTLGEESSNNTILLGEAAAHYSFKKGNTQQDYPSSLMGAIALLRQTYYDARWYANTDTKPEEYNASLEAFNQLQGIPQIFEVRDYLSAFRADKIGDEFGVQYIIKGSGEEYRRIEAIKNTNATFILPLNFPKAYDVEDPYDAMLVSLEEMKHWEMAPANPYFFEQHEIPFALTAAGLEKPEHFWKNLRKAVQHGLSKETALKAITQTPAELVHLESKIGSLGPKMIANFIITSGDLFDAKTTIYQNWIQGKPYIINPKEEINIAGKYSLNIDTHDYDLKVSKKKKGYSAKIISTEKEIPVKINKENLLIALNFKLDDENFNGIIRLSGKINYKSGIWDGNGKTPEGKWIKWNAIKQRGSFNEVVSEKDSSDVKIDSITTGSPFFPNMAYGFDSIPKADTLLIKNATIWTNESQGIIQNGELFIRNGKIVSVGKGLEVPENVKVLDANGKHISPGIIDEHSHIAISRGVNESAQAVTAEVSIADVVKSNDINIYRQLAGGVTAAQLLHGSANPIGGQSALIKMRWGQSPEAMKIKNADGFIKFALGENVKQSNWGNYNRYRFPQTRMGVEQVFYDAFIRAKEYEKEWKDYNELGRREKEKATPPRKDLELETLVEILNKKRFVTCHSYVQSEINMLMHVADSMGFSINTFTHILEGYKIADKMKKHGVAGSTFSDWWAYKFEVNDAIPYNGALMHNQGVLTAFNSDDAEMGRRLNQEAAKAVKYGGVSEEEALKFITLNPAKILHLDDRMGSLKPGKDADFVIWSNHPLSVYAQAEKTFVDGICYFDLERDKKLRTAIARERARIIAKMLAAKKKGEPTQQPKKKEHKLYHCDTIEKDY